MEQNKINFPFIELNRGLSFSTGKEVLDYAPFFYFDSGPKDSVLHERFVELYKTKNENANTKTS